MILIVNTILNQVEVVAVVGMRTTVLYSEELCWKVVLRKTQISLMGM